MTTLYPILKKIHRKFRIALKERFRPEVSQRKLRSFIKSKHGLDKPIFATAKKSSIAIVVPCFGHANFLQEMFESIFRQTIAPTQVIFVVDQSPDSSLEILNRLITQYQPAMEAELVLLENQENLGQAASLNKGIEYSNCEIIMILNDDDYLMHDCIEVTLKILEKYPQVALLGGHSLHFGGNELKDTTKLIEAICPADKIEVDIRYPHQALSYRKYNDVNMTHSGSSFYKSAWKHVGGYYPNKSTRLVHFSDRDFQLRMSALFPIALSNVTPLSCWRNDSSVDQGVNS